jgi:hypothetical protein
MASTYSTLKFELIGTGEQSGTWGNTTNTNLGTAIQEAITGSADVTFASGTVTLTLTDTNATQTARNLRLNLIGTSGGAQNLVVPDIEKFYLVNNACADAITVKNSTGATVAVPASKAMLLFSTGSAVVDAVTHMSSLTLTTALAIAQGGTGATTADTALDNLGGTTVGKGVFKAATAAAAQQAMDTEVGVDVQAWDAQLDDLAALAVTDGNIIVGDGTNWVAESGATARTSLGLGSIATQDSSAVTITGGSITGITDLAVADGGTGQGSYTDGELLIGNTTGNTLTKATLTAGTGISVTNGSGAITIASTGGGGFANMDVFTSTGTWTNPGSVTKVKVTVVGGGGGGNPGRATSPTVGSHGGGGGGGGTAIEVITIPTSPVAVTVGAGGPGGSTPAAGTSNAGGTGGTSSFSTYCSATGGTAGGVPGTENYKAGAGGAGSGGTLDLTGGAGVGGDLVPGGNSGVGGPSSLGGGGRGGDVPQSRVTQTGNTGGGGVVDLELIIILDLLIYPIGLVGQAVQA